MIQKHHEVGSGLYDMALAVQSGLLPEKTFAPRPRRPLPAVCIEGIRVSDTLPGFDSRDSDTISALISVRGVRGLRTTVSRSGLEKDEEYLNLGRICVALLVDHIKEEITRISSDKGKPLSRASTSGKWLSWDLRSAISSDVVREWLFNSRRKLPLIVIESIKTENQSPVIERGLVSPDTLEKLSHFWTIESRLVDSLGIISRDLGRELSLNEFLTSLAPEHTDLGYSPILPDAHLFTDDILGSHHPTLVQFNLLYQQTAIKWTTGKTDNSDTIKSLVEDEAFKVNLSQHLNRPFRMGRPLLELYSLSNIPIAEIKGDELNISIVKTRMVTVLAKGSEVARTSDLIEQGILLTYQKRDVQGFAKCLKLNNLYRHLLYGRNRRFPNRSVIWDGLTYEESILQEEEFFDHPDMNRTWTKMAMEVNAVLNDYGIKEDIPNSAHFVLNAKYFNASDYWRDWYRIEKK